MILLIDNGSGTGGRRMVAGDDSRDQVGDGVFVMVGERVEREGEEKGEGERQ
jgi:hypothetical protein